MKPTIIIGLLTVLMLASCAAPIAQQDATVTYTTYGGFTMPQHALSIITIEGSDVTISYAWPNGTVSSSVGYTASRASIAALQAAIRSSDHPELPAVVEEPEQVLVADVGSANLTIERGNERSHTVIELNYEPEIPADIARIIEAIYDVTAEAPQPEYGAQLAYEPMQCEQTPWETWYAEGNIQYFAEPSQQQLISDYYAQEYDIEINGVDERTRDGAVCEACGICPQSFYYVIFVNSDDVAELESLGWGHLTVESEPEISLEGEWNLARGTIEGETVDFEATLAVGNEGIGGRGPCNSYSGPASFTSGSVSVGNLITTLMYCEGSMDDEQAYYAALGAADSYTLSSTTLTLEGDGVELVYVREAQDEPEQTIVYFIDKPCEENPSWYPDFGSGDTSGAQAHLSSLGVDANVTFTSRGAVCRACLDTCAGSYLTATIDRADMRTLITDGWVEELPFDA